MIEMDITGIAKSHQMNSQKTAKPSSKKEWKLSDSLREKITEYAKEDAAQNVYMGNKFLALRKSEVAKVAPDRAGFPGFWQIGELGKQSCYIKMEEILMKKRAGFFLAMMCVLTLVGCGTSNNAEKAENNLSQPVVIESMTSEEINVVSASDGAQEPVQNTQPAIDDLSQPEEVDYQKDVEQSNSDIQEKEEGLMDVTETVEAEQDSQITVRQDIININEINELGGIIEFAGDMTYKEFTDLNWVSDIDNSLDEDTSVYIVKIYYPNGFEHHKVGKIENCEAIGVYRTDDGEYLGGSFRERATQS